MRMTPALQEKRAAVASGDERRTSRKLPDREIDLTLFDSEDAKDSPHGDEASCFMPTVKTWPTLKGQVTQTHVSDAADITATISITQTG